MKLNLVIRYNRLYKSQGSSDSLYPFEQIQSTVNSKSFHKSMEQSAYFGGNQVYGGSGSVYLGRVYDPRTGEYVEMPSGRAVHAYPRSAYFPVARPGENLQVRYSGASHGNNNLPVARAYGENLQDRYPSASRVNSVFHPVRPRENLQVSYPSAPRDNTSVYFHPVRPRENLQVSYTGASSGNDIHVSYPTTSNADTSEYFQNLNMDGAPARPSGENLHVSYHSTSRGNGIPYYYVFIIPNI
ncbi:unnamed protein product [Meloidogyne enterolobii]|uniref:Uncharacterized protein n=1 Tax=Meloidogyne enterolobii TaxID=390850 RepID=A0ACB1AB90_MELEN